MTVFVGNPAADEAFIATLMARLPGCIDLITKVNAFNSWFYTNGRRIALPGSHTLLGEVEINESNDITWFMGNDPLDMTYTPGKTMLQYGHHFGAIPIPISMTDKVLNRDGVVHDIYMQRFNHVLRTLQNRSAHFTLNGNGGKEPLGFLNAIEALAEANQVATVGGVSKSTATWFRNRFVTMSDGTNFGDVANTGMYLGILKIIQLITACRRGAMFPNAVFVNSAIHENVLRAQAALFGLRTADGPLPDVKVGSFRNVEILGVPIIEEASFPANTILCITSSAEVSRFGNVAGGSEGPTYMLTPDDIGGCFMGYHSEVNLAVTPPRQVAANVLGEVSFVLLSQTNWFSNMKAQGRGGILSGGTGSFDNWS